MATIVLRNRSKIVMKPEAAKNQARKLLELRLKKSGEYITNRVKENLSVAGRKEGPSKPGEFPHANTGRLRNSIFWRFSPDKPMRVIIGTPLKYGLWLEAGTAGGTVILPKKGKVLAWKSAGKMVFARRVVKGAMASRSFLKRTLRDEWNNVKLIMAGKK